MAGAVREQGAGAPGRRWRRCCRRQRHARSSLASGGRRQRSPICRGASVHARLRRGAAQREDPMSATAVHQAAQKHNELGLLLIEVGRVEEAVAQFETAIQLDPGDHGWHSNLLLALNYRAYDRATVLARHREWAARHSLPRLEPVRYRHARSRIGFVSPNVLNCAEPRFLLPLLRHLDRQRFEVFLYSVTRPRYEDAVTATLRSLADRWHAGAWNDAAALAQRIRDDEIDLLVDLGGHIGYHALKAFTMRPAPVQATYLGDLSTTGIDAIDYFITDAVAAPAGDEFFAERLWRVPPPFLCYEPRDDAPEVTPTPALRNGYVTFGSFNILAKLSDETVALWSRVLEATPGSRLLLKAA